MKKNLQLLLTMALVAGAIQFVNAGIVTVTNLNDNGAGSLRQAISDAASGDTINFSVTGNIVLDTSITWNKSLTILGPGVSKLVIDGNNATNMFIMKGGKNLVRNIAFRHGFGGDNYGGCIEAPYNVTSTTILEYCSFSHCSTNNMGGAINCNYLIMRHCSVDSCTALYGGGIEAFDVILENSTFSNCLGNGGAVDIESRASSITNCSFINNSSPNYGGAICFTYTESVLFLNNTFSGNSATILGSDIYIITGNMANISLIFQNNIFNSPKDNYGDDGFLIQVTKTSNGGNISNDNSMSAFLTATNDKNNTDPLLDTAGLKNNGGDVMTIALQAASPAINNGISTGAPVLDERGYSRSGLIDAGAFEYHCSLTAADINVNGCGSYSSPSGKYLWQGNGTFKDTIPNAAGCDSVITIHLTQVVFDTTITQSGIQLTAKESGVTYKWLDCDAVFAPLGIGDTLKSFTATKNGNYAVEITKNGCVDTLACYSITNVGVKNIAESKNNFSIYPNPTNNKITIDGVTSQNTTLSIKNIVGELVFQTQLNNAKNEIDISNFSKGIYIVKIESSQGIMQQKLIKE